MPVIKSQDTGTMTRGAIVLDMGDLRAQAARLKQQAEQRAQAIIEEAQRDGEQRAKQAADEAYKDGEKRGFEKGLNEGRTKGHAEALAQMTEKLSKTHQALTQAVTTVEAIHADIRRDASQAVLDLAVSMAEKLVHRVVEVDRSIVIDQVAQALALVLRPVEVTIRISPDDRPVMLEALPQLAEQFKQIQHVHLVDDANVSPGGCLVEHGQGRIDATIATQLDRVIDLIRPNGPEAPHATDAPLDEPASDSDNAPEREDDNAS